MVRLFSNAHCLRPFLVVALMLLMSPILASAQTATFTYQGRLQDGGTPANGSYDLQLTLWDAASGGTQQPQPSPVTVTRTSVLVTGGIFSVQLDFGANAFPGADRFLEIGVRPAGSGSFTILSPRQQTTSTPYAIRSANATTANSATTATTATNSTQLGGVAASQYVLTGDSRLTDSRVPTAGSTNYIQNTTSPQVSANFNISGNGTASGTLSSNIINATTQYNLGNSRVLSMPGSGNLFLGVNSGQANTGSFNSFFGAGAGQSNTTAGRNSFFGNGAGFSNTASSNSFFGTGAGQSNTTGARNSFFGDAAGLGNLAGSTGSDNSFFGNGAGQFYTTGGHNSFFGTQAGQNNGAGGNNAFFGTSAGQANTSGANNAFFGTSAGQANTTQNGNAFFGWVAGQNNTGIFNSFFGSQAGQTNTTGGDNAFFGAGAGFSNTTGGDNAFFGFEAGESNTEGTRNSFFGNAAGLGNFLSTSSDNSFFGDHAGQFYTTGGANSFFGSGAGNNNTTGSNNSFFGTDAGFRNTIGTTNAFFGSLTGTFNTTGGKITLIGDDADVELDGLFNATAIGADARVAQSNSLVLGNNANVGIGTTAPTAKLVVSTTSTSAGENTATFRAITIGPNQSHIHYGTTGDWYIRSAASTGRVILQDTGGNVGIGTGAPDSMLTVNGTADKPGGGSWATFSDERLKNVKGRFTTGLKAVMQLQPLRYEYKRDNALGITSDGDHIGFGAQAMQRIIPEAVTTNDKGYLLVNNDPILWTMLNAIKEQQAQIQQQQQQIKQQQDETETLKKLVCLDHPGEDICKRKD